MVRGCDHHALGHGEDLLPGSCSTVPRYMYVCMCISIYIYIYIYIYICLSLSKYIYIEREREREREPRRHAASDSASKLCLTKYALPSGGRTRVRPCWTLVRLNARSAERVFGWTRVRLNACSARCSACPSCSAAALPCCPAVSGNRQTCLFTGPSTGRLKRVEPKRSLFDDFRGSWHENETF